LNRNAARRSGSPLIKTVIVHRKSPACRQIQRASERAPKTEIQRNRGRIRGKEAKRQGTKDREVKETEKRGGDARNVTTSRFLLRKAKKIRSCTHREDHVSMWLAD
jgi:hypothetical protein